MFVSRSFWNALLTHSLLKRSSSCNALLLYLSFHAYDFRQFRLSSFSFSLLSSSLASLCLTPSCKGWGLTIFCDSCWLIFDQIQLCLLFSSPMLSLRSSDRSLGQNDGAFFQCELLSPPKSVTSCCCSTFWHLTHFMPFLMLELFSQKALSSFGYFWRRKMKMSLKRSWRYNPKL